MEINEAMRLTRRQAKSLRIVADGQGDSFLGEEYRKKADALEAVCGEVVRLRKELEAQQIRRVRQVFEHR